MTKGIIINDNKVYQCESCCLTYKDKKWVEKCEAWCKKHHSCSLKIACYSTEVERRQKY